MSMRRARSPARKPEVVPDHRKYLSSLADELLSQADRVRNLIGSRHWLSDGQHKEAILVSVLERHLPAGVLARRGFIVNPDDPDRISREQDVIVVDTSAEAPVFARGDFVVALSSCVLATISVKTTMDRNSLRDTCDVLASARGVDSVRFGDGRMWCGGFFYQANRQITGSPAKAREQIAAAVATTASSPGAFAGAAAMPDYLCAVPDLVFRPGDGPVSAASILAHSCERLAVAVFLVALLDHVKAIRTNTRSDISRLLRGIPCTPI